jgi:hypothetical protein
MASLSQSEIKGSVSGTTFGTGRCCATTQEQPIMAHEPNPNDAYRDSDPYRATNPSRPIDNDEVIRDARLEREVRTDPELAEGPANAGKITLFAVAVALLLGAVFYGFNNSSMRQSGTTSTAQTPAPTTAQNTGPTSPPAAPPGMRDVTPRPNTGPGVTTGAAPSQTPPPPANPANAPASK